MSYKDSFFHQAVKEHQKGNLSAAEQGYRDILRLDPNHPGALHQLAMIEFERKHYEAAVSLIDKSLHFVSDELQWWLDYGNILKAAGQTGEAVSTYKKALVIFPDNTELISELTNLQQDQPGTVTKPSEAKTDEEIARTYGLTYHVSYTRAAEQTVGLKDLRVLEVGGSLPREFVLNDIGVRSWIAVESMGYWDEALSSGFLSGTPPQNSLPDIWSEESDIETQSYCVFSGNIEKLPKIFNGKFDRVFSIAAFEHILRMPAALDRMYDALASGGLLFSLFAPVWSAYNGHHLPSISDGHGGVCDFSNSPIPPWGHLLLSPGEMIRSLEMGVGREIAQEMAYFVYESPHINRYFTEDYADFVSNSRFKQERLEPVFRGSVPQDMSSRLKARYPHRQYFDNNGILMILRKE